MSLDKIPYDVFGQIVPFATSDSILTFASLRTCNLLLRDQCDKYLRENKVEAQYGYPRTDGSRQRSWMSSFSCYCGRRDWAVRDHCLCDRMCALCNSMVPERLLVKYRAWAGGF